MTRVLLSTLASAMVLSAVLSAQAQDPVPPPQQAPAASPADMSAKCQAMMADHEKVIAEMKAADQRLDELIAKMNSASGEAKVDATAAAVTEIAAARKTMRERMMHMHQGMMGHMADHAAAGPQSMSMCPMMKMGGVKH